MAPREANNPFPDQYLTIEYDASALLLPQGPGPGVIVDTGDLGDTNTDTVQDVPIDAQAGAVDGTEMGGDAESENDNEQDSGFGQHAATQPPTEVHLQSGTNFLGNSPNAQQNTQGISPSFLNQFPTESNEFNQDVDPLSIDMTDAGEEAWSSRIVDEALASAAVAQCSLNVPSRIRSHTAPANEPVASRNTSTSYENSGNSQGRRIPRRASTPTLSSPQRGLGTSSPFPLSSNGSEGSIERRRHLFRHAHASMNSVLDQDPSIDSCSEDEDDHAMTDIPELDMTNDTSTSSSSLQEYDDYPSTPQSQGPIISQVSNLVLEGNECIPHSASNTTQRATNLSLTPIRQMLRGSRGGTSNEDTFVVTDEDNTSVSSLGGSITPVSENPDHLDAAAQSPSRMISSSVNAYRRSSIHTNGSGRSIHWTSAFESSTALDLSDGNTTVVSSEERAPDNSVQSNQSSQLNLSFGPNTNVADLKYFAERGCIVPLLRALDTPRLKTLGTRMLADYAKMPNRRVAVASNRRILEFCCRTMLEVQEFDGMGTEWPAREYAVETIRSLTATEDSDKFLMGCSGLLKALAIVARGGPFARKRLNMEGRHKVQTTTTMGLVSGKARLHACIAIMNLSCGKANKVEIGSIPEVLEAMRDVMLASNEEFVPATSSPPLLSGNSNSATPGGVAKEARLKAATCIKNLSNADQNDSALLGSPGLIGALGQIAVMTCHPETGASPCTTNACLALMNLSIAKANKHTVFKTDGIMESLMTVIKRTSPKPGLHRSSTNVEARIKACSALSNLAIGYENKIPMFAYPGFVDSILEVIETDTGEARTKACSILWSFAAEMRNQVPVVQRGDILPTLVRVAEEDHSTEARFKCVAALTLLAESLDNAIPLLESGALHPLMDILHESGADPTQWQGQTASWCVGFLMNMAQSDDAAPTLREAGVVELLAPLLTLDHYQSLKAAMAITFVCRYDEDDETYDLLRKTENVIPKIISLLHNTLSGRGGSGYKYGVFTLRSSVGCISSLASGPEFMKERIATGPVFESVLRVLSDFCVNGGTKGAIVGGGRDDALSATLAVRTLHSLVEYLIPVPGSSALPFGADMDKRLLLAFESFENCSHPEVKDETRRLAFDAFHRIQRSKGLVSGGDGNDSGSEGGRRRRVRNNIIENSIVASLVQGCCIGPSLHTGEDDGYPSMLRSTGQQQVADSADGNDSLTSSASHDSEGAIRTFLLTDEKTGRRFAVPTDPSGGRTFNDFRQWCYRRGRFCRDGEVPDINFRWTEELQAAYSIALMNQPKNSSSGSSVTQVTKSSSSNSV